MSLSCLWTIILALPTTLFSNTLIICVHSSLRVLNGKHCSSSCLFQRSLACRECYPCATASPNTFHNNAVLIITLGAVHLLRTRRLKKPQTNSLSAETALITQSVGNGYGSRTDQLTRLSAWLKAAYLQMKRLLLHWKTKPSKYNGNSIIMLRDRFHVLSLITKSCMSRIPSFYSVLSEVIWSLELAFETLLNASIVHYPCQVSLAGLLNLSPLNKLEIAKLLSTVEKILLYLYSVFSSCLKYKPFIFRLYQVFRCYYCRSTEWKSFLKLGCGNAAA